MRTILKEPLLHFLLLAGLLFVADWIWSSRQKDQIVVGQQTVDYLIKQREDLELRELSPDEKRQTIVAFIDDEILYNEAYKQGLDRRDTRMRRNMIRKMRGLLMGEVSDPTEADLVKYFNENRDDYTRSASRSLVQIYYRDSSSVPENLLMQLQTGLDPESVGDKTLNFGRTLSHYSNSQLSRVLGPDAAKAIIAINDNQWHGPLESIHGVHFVRIAEQHPETIPRYEDIKAYLAADLMASLSRKAVDERLILMRRDYNIIIDWDAFEQ